MPLEHRATLPGAPARVLDLVTDAEFLRDCADQPGVVVENVDVQRADGVVRTILTLRASTAGIPGAYARFVGAEIVVADGRTWTSDGDGGWVADVDVRATVFGCRAVVSGRQTLRPASGGTETTTTAEVSVDAPFVARQAEAAVTQLVSVVLRRETALLHARLAD